MGWRWGNLTKYCRNNMDFLQFIYHALKFNRKIIYILFFLLISRKKYGQKKYCCHFHTFLCSFNVIVYLLDSSKNYFHLLGFFYSSGNLVNKQNIAEKIKAAVTKFYPIFEPINIGCIYSGKKLENLNQNSNQILAIPIV